MIYLVASVVYACAGLTILGVPLLPAAAHPALAAVGLCRAVPRVEPYDPARLSAVQQRVRELGPGAALLRCDRRIPARRLWRRATGGAGGLLLRAGACDLGHLGGVRRFASIYGASQTLTGRTYTGE